MRTSGPSFGDVVEVKCTARVGNDEVVVTQVVHEAVYSDPDAREAVHEAVRFKLMAEIAKKWKPRIEVRR